mgnify:FL=1
MFLSKSYVHFFLTVFVDFSFRRGSVIVHFILYFKTAVTPEKGIENLRVAISANDTIGDFQVEELVIYTRKSTNSTTTTGIKGLGILFIALLFGLRVHICSGFHSPPLCVLLFVVSRLVVFSPRFFCHILFLSLVS